jgi:hypothetical protein
MLQFCTTHPGYTFLIVLVIFCALEAIVKHIANAIGRHHD